jgi:hypothetical protein
MAALGDKVVLFGGAGTAFLNDKWEWDGATWTERHPRPRYFRDQREI